MAKRPLRDPFRARQVHLDFHTSEHVPDVGARFSKKQFQQALKLGQVDAINVFAKCHHSWCYYPTAHGAGPHPNLRVPDLLGGQIEACHAIGVRAPVYYTVGWSATDAEQHPDWCVHQRDGSVRTMNYDLAAKPTDPKPGVSWKLLCPSGGYRDLMLAQTREVCERYDVDGLWYDICMTEPCWCERCRAGMREAGLDEADDGDARAYSVRKWVSFMDACRTVLFDRHPHATVFFNGLTNTAAAGEVNARQTHFELEDLPTTWGGYDKLPPRARYFLSLPEAEGGSPADAFGKKFLIAMSGKFHTSWGEFGGFKHPDAIRYEAASMVAYGAMCCFGDQLHPSGEMDLATYRNLGAGYDYVKRIETYGIGARPTANLGVLFGQRRDARQGRNGPATVHDNGVCNMLMEGHLDFDVAQRGGDWSRFDAIVLTGAPCLDDADAAQLRAFVKRGGGLVALGESPLDAAGATMLLDVGGRYEGPPRFREDYTVAGKELGGGRELVASPFLNYEAAPRVVPTDGRVLARIKEPFFDRTYGRYCSHLNTPNQLGDAGHVAGLQKGRVVYLPHALGKLYHDHGARVHRDLFLNALARVYKDPVLRIDLPSAGRATLVHQPEHSRYVLHVLYAPPLQRGRALVIEDLPPLYDVRANVGVRERVKRATLPVTGKRLALTRVKDRVALTVPEVAGHAVVALEY